MFNPINELIKVALIDFLDAENWGGEEILEWYDNTEFEVGCCNAGTVLISPITCVIRFF